MLWLHVDEIIYPSILVNLVSLFQILDFASDEGLLAYGGGLEPNRILTAYRKGIFPWFNKEDPILWWSS